MTSDAGEQAPSDQPKLGAPFSQVYLRPSAPMKDSQRFRNRLAAYITSNVSATELVQLVTLLECNMGADQLHINKASHVKIFSLARTGELRDVLDAITYFARWISFFQEKKIQKVQFICRSVV